MTFLTNLKLEPKGIHSAAQAYNVSDVVTSADGSVAYAAVKDVPAGIALSNAEYWVKVLDLAGVRAAAVSATESANAAAESANAAAESAETKASNSLKYIVYDLTDPFSASGNPVQCNPVGGLIFDGLETQFSPKQEGSGDPSPENIRPISGYDKLSLACSGKNLLPNTASSTVRGGITYTVNYDGSIHLTGTSTSETVFFTIGETTLPAGEYVLSGFTTDAQMWIYVNGERRYTPGDRFALSEPGIVRCNIYVRNVHTYDHMLYPMIRLASDSDSTYEPFRGKAHAVQIGQTVYGGTMNWLTGELVAEWEFVELTGKENISVYSESDLGQSLVIYNVLNASTNRATGISSHTLVRKYLDTKNRIVIGNNNRNIYWTAIADILGLYTEDEFAAWFAAQYAAGTPVQVAWLLATPQTIQLTPQQIAALQGVNTLYGDGDTITAAGRQSKAIALESRIEALEAAILNA